MEENSKEHVEFWAAINTMRGWVIAAAGAVILQLGILVIGLVTHKGIG